MANIDQDLQRIMEARYGRDVRQSIHDAIYDINIVADEAHTVAVDSQESAYHSAQDAASSASDASISANDADGKATLSESWAHGGTGTRQGEDTDNAEYWARQAQGAVAGVASFNGRSGAVLPAQDDYTIDQIKATGTQGQVPTLNAQGKLEMQTPSGGSGGHTIINSSGDEMTQRSKLKFANATVTDDGVNDATIITTMSGGMVAKFDITSDAGSTVTVTTPSGDVITAEQKIGSTTEWEANTTEYGTHTLTSTLNGQTATTTVMVDTCKVYMVAVAQFNATITVTYPTGATCTCTGGGESYTATSNPQVFTVHSANTYTITVTNGTITKTESVVITTDGQSESLTITLVPDGSTVTPTDDIQIWLHCADIWDKSYTTLAEVLADTTTLSALIANSNAVDYLVRSTTWAINGGLVPIMTSNTTPSGVCSASSVLTYQGVTREAYFAFDGYIGTLTDNWYSSDDTFPQWLQYEFPSAVQVLAVSFRAAYLASQAARVKDYKIQASNDGINYVDLTEVLTGVNTYDADNAGVLQTANFTKNIGAYKYYRMYILNMYGQYQSGVAMLQFHARAFSNDGDSITTNQTAMSYIGLNNYCANTLLDDDTWCNAICNSTYFESVLNVKVPTMTSNTTPSGECFATANNSDAYKTFDGGDVYYWLESSSNTTNNAGVGYDFNKSLVLHRTVITKHMLTTVSGAGTSVTATMVIQGSNGNDVWDDLATVALSNPGDSGGTTTPLSSDLAIASSTKYQKYRVFFKDKSRATRINVYEVQFYGREDV